MRAERKTAESWFWDCSPGTLLLVYRDRWFVSRLATRIIEISADGVNDFVGSYNQYLDRLGDDHLDRAAALSRANRERRERKAATRAV